MNKKSYDIDQVESQNGINSNGIHNDDGKDVTDIAFVNDAYKSDDMLEAADELNADHASSSSSANDKEKHDEAKEIEEQAVTALQLFRYATGLDWLCMFIATIASVINGAIQPGSFILFGEVINQFIDFESNRGKEVDIEDELTFIAEIYVYAALLTIVTGYVGNTLWLYSSIRQSFVIRCSCFESIMRQDIGWFDTHDTGELSTRLSDDITKIQNGIGDKVGALTSSISMLLTGVIIGFVFSWKLTLVTIAMCPVLVIAAFITGKVISVITSEEQTAYAKAGSIAEEVLSSIRTVVAFGGEEKEIARYKLKLVDAEKAGIKKGISSGFAFGVFNAVIFCCCALGFWYGGVLVSDGDLEGGDLLIVFFAIMMGAAQFGQTGPNIEAFMVARGAAFKIYALIERRSVIDPMSTEGIQPDIKGVIEFQDCKFNYPSRPHIKILKGLSLSIPKGTTCALVGESGCGKSTLIKLVQRFYDVDDGNVLIDGHNTKEINVRYLRKHIGVVSQEPVLFDTTIGENIKLGNSDATQEMIEEAAHVANAYNFINELPKKFDTFVGEGGAQLSGGQKQRIAIARALVRDPKILLLDEATSALDTESEAIIQGALENARQGRTTLVVAHRLSTVRNADMIAVVVDGCIVELGTHDELMKNRGEYFKLVMLQTFEEKAEKEEENEDKELLGVANKEEIDKIIRQKVLRSLSQISTKEEEVEAFKQAFEKQLSHQKSIRKNKQREMKKQVSVKEEEIEEEIPENIPSFMRIIKLNLKEWPYMAVGAFFAAIAGGMPVAFAIILSEVLNSFTLTEQPQKMRDDSEFWSIQFMVVGLAIGLSYFVAQYLFAIAGEGLTSRLREMAFRSLLRQEIAYFDVPQHSTGALTARLASDASAVQGATSTRLNTLTQVIVMGFTSLLVGFIYSWQLTLVILCMVPLMAFAGAVQTKLNTSFASDNLKYMDEAGSIATESIMQIRTVASLGTEEYFYQRYVNLLIGPTKKAKRGAHFFGISFGLSFGLILFADAASFRMGGYLAAEGKLSLADLMKVMMAVIFGSMTAGQLASFAPDYVKAKVAAGRILDLFDRKPPIDSYSEEGLKTKLNGEVEFSDVKFSYPSRENVPVLQGLTLKITQGQTLAFVGQSGCGKSTSVSLIERFYDATGGVLQIDGKPVTDYNVRHLRSELGIVQQEPVLFDCSIRDNILYGVDQTKVNISQEKIEKVAKDSNIHNFIMNLPNGYDTNVGEKGALISGGQKQRIAIARALIRNPKILLLDEATSALDSESEKIVQEALDVAMEGRTAIMIAHRLSTVQNADIIAVIQGGKIVEVGTHQELIAKKGAYFLLNQAQL